MMIKTAALTGKALDLMVSKCKGIEVWVPTIHIKNSRDSVGNPVTYAPSTEWAQGGPIIEEWQIDICAYRGSWRASRHVGTAPTYGHGATPLIAAMRAYVISKLGETVEVPEELK